MWCNSLHRKCKNIKYCRVNLKTIIESLLLVFRRAVENAHVRAPEVPTHYVSARPHLSLSARAQCRRLNCRWWWRKGSIAEFHLTFYHRCRTIYDRPFCPTRPIPRRWGTRPVWKGRDRRDSPAPPSLLQGLRLPFQHHRTLDSSSSPAMERLPEEVGLDPGRGLTGSHPS